MQIFIQEGSCMPNDLFFIEKELVTKVLGMLLDGSRVEAATNALLKKKKCCLPFCNLI